ncbi:DUF1592 domain-containing protein [Schlesneria sp.]|uniref:DUF1592 domain-containing protein n=1 Tax=Schlesneria sp. TaxID=2762018 RepID=UPI002F02E8D6
MQMVRFLNWVVAGSIVTCGITLAAEPTDFSEFSRSYSNDVRRIISRTCDNCHSPELSEADIDLTAFPSLDEVRNHPEVWQKVNEMLESGQMPPKDAPQPTDAERTRLKQWVRGYLKLEAKSRAGDPGRVVLRRLNNVEYTNTIRELTGVPTLSPAREFPVDSAAGEGFTNLGNALAMSPAMVTKYFDAAKEIANHAILLPHGFRFSATVTPRDWTDELLAQIRGVYGEFTDAEGGTQVNLQGIVFDTNGGGRLPVKKYLLATLEERDALKSGRKTIEKVAEERSLSPKYLRMLWSTLTSEEPSFLFDRLRSQWRDATPKDTPQIAAEIAQWQQALWRFTSIGHIGKVGGPKAWMEPVSPITTRTDIRMKLPASSDGEQVSVYLTTMDGGDGNEHDYVVWQQPRLVAPGRPDVLLRDVRRVTAELAERRDRSFAATVRCLAAATEAGAAQGNVELADLAKRHKVDADLLAAWLNYLGVGTGGHVQIENYFTNQLSNVSGYVFAKGWGSHETPLMVVNSSDEHVRIPGNLKPHGVTVHPSPDRQAVVGWKSPVSATVRVEAKIQHAHPECGNGVTWTLELRRGATRQRLRNGISHGDRVVVADPIADLKVQPEDVISLLIGPRDGNHSCDLTAIDLTITSTESGGRSWDLSADVSPDIHAGNPHADRFGNEGIWHFYTEPVNSASQGPVIPEGSLLAKWQVEKDPAARQKLAEEIQRLLIEEPRENGKTADQELRRQLRSLNGPLFGGMPLPALKENKTAGTSAKSDVWGPDPALFGVHPNGQKIESESLCVKAPSVLEVRLPADFAAGYELVTSGILHPETGKEGTVQLQVLTTKPDAAAGLIASKVTAVNANSQWTDNKWVLQHSTPILVSDSSTARKRVEAGFESFRNLFPAALCYSRIVPVDEVVTLTLFFREDRHLVNLMLNEEQARKLDRLWSELHFVSRDALTLVDAYNQLMEFATQDADPKVFEPLRKPIYDRAKQFEQELVDAEPRQLDQLIQFASRAYRRPLTDQETHDLRSLYRKLREQELPHEEAFRFTLARVLIAPAFLYRVEPFAAITTAETEIVPVNDWALASRLSYFLWSAPPDAELNHLASAEHLHEPDTLVAEARRMLKSERIRALSTEFACQWLGVRDFDSHSEKSDQVFPTFSDLRDDMYEETVQFFVDLFQRDGSVLDVLDADYTFLNEPLAKHYGIPGVNGPEWRRVEGIRQYGRGGILTFATTLAQQSGASRTSPILRGNWVLESLLGEKLPRPPANIPPLPESETDTDLTVRELTEKHRSIAACAHCHDRIDAFGFSLEGFDAIGRRRDRDLGGRVIDVNVELPNGTRFTGESGLRDYLLQARRNDFLKHFCKKLLGYSLARGVQLSDEPLLDEMIANLQSNDYRFSAAVETILRSQQFRFQRGNVPE